MDGLIFRKTAPDDRPALEALWREAFGEDGAWFFDAIDAPGYCADDGAVCAMAFTIPQTLVLDRGEFPAAYIYAVATARRCRGRGLATELLRVIEENLRAEGVCGAVLVPATPPLFPLYERMGWRVWACRPAAAPFADAPCSAEEYLSLRREALPRPFLQPPECVVRCYRTHRGGAASPDGQIAESFGAPVTNVPFAMAKAFTDDFPAQGYFSLALE